MFKNSFKASSLTALVIITALTLLSAYGCTVDTGFVSSGTSGDTISTDTAETPGDTITESEKPAEDEYYTIGNTLSAKSYNLTVTSAQEIESSNMFIQPQDGNVYLEIAVILENTSQKELNISSLLHFNAYVDDMAVSMELLSPSEKGTVDGTIAPGKKLSGALCYQVPENWAEFELSVSNITFNSKDDLSLVIKK